MAETEPSSDHAGILREDKRAGKQRSARPRGHYVPGARQQSLWKTSHLTNARDSLKEVVGATCGSASDSTAWPHNCQMLSISSVPHEMERILESLCPRTIMFVGFGVSGSEITERPDEVMGRDRNPLVNCKVDSGGVTLKIVSTAETPDVAEAGATETEKTLRQALGDVVFGTGDQTLAEVVGNSLLREGRTLATAESCTGGLVAKLITDIPGASRYFARGWVTYSNEAKADELGVAPELIAEHGAASAEVAAAMAQGARRAAAADYAIGITGIAGPDGGTEQKPVGLVCIVVDHQSGTDTSQHIFSRGRWPMHVRSAPGALNLLLRLLES